MRTAFAGTLSEGERVSEVFALRSKELRSSRTGDAYLALEFADRTGRISAVMFRPDLSAQSIPARSVVVVDGVATTYRGVLRISVERLRLALKWSASDLLPASPRDTDELMRRLRELAREVKDPALARVIRTVFGDREFMKRFKRCPGAQSHHHAYIGGLLEHTVAVAVLCQSTAGLYGEVDHDLLLTAALLHDIGRVDELSYTTDIDYTDEGRLIGHTVLGYARLRDAMEKAGGLSPELKTRLSHLMLSHHGQPEGLALRLPSTLEAIILHHADDLDARATGFIESASCALRVEEQWTDSVNPFRRPLFVPSPQGAAQWITPGEVERSMLRGA